MADDAPFTALEWAALVLACAPLLAAQLALGVACVGERARAWAGADPRAPLRVAAALTGLFLLVGASVGRFDPYAAAIVGLSAAATLGALREARSQGGTFTWIDAAVWLLLWIPFDLRWYNTLWQGPRDCAYTWWAVGVSVLAVFGWSSLREFPGIGYRLIPTARDLRIALAALFGFAAIALPVGLLSGFLHWPPSKSPTTVQVATHFVGLFIGVALPEELFFRGLLQNGLERTLRRPWLALLLASLAFGLMHWNNAGDLRTKLLYCALASVAGLFYGWAYRRSGGLIAAILVHTLTDLIWHFALKK